MADAKKQVRMGVPKKGIDAEETTDFPEPELFAVLVHDEDPTNPKYALTLRVGYEIRRQCVGRGRTIHQVRLVARKKLRRYIAV